MMTRFDRSLPRLLEKCTSHKEPLLSSPHSFVSPLVFPLFFLLLLTCNLLMASSGGARKVVEEGTHSVVAGGPPMAAQRKRGRPKGSKNKATLKAEAEAAARGRNLRFRGPQEMAAGFISPKGEAPEQAAVAAVGGR